VPPGIKDHSGVWALWLDSNLACTLLSLAWDFPERKTPPRLRKALPISRRSFASEAPSRGSLDPSMARAVSVAIGGPINERPSNVHVGGLL
jgi:hypothetical protein